MLSIRKFRNVFALSLLISFSVPSFAAPIHYLVYEKPSDRARAEKLAKKKSTPEEKWVAVSKEEAARVQQEYEARKADEAAREAFIRGYAGEMGRQMAAPPTPASAPGAPSPSNQTWCLVDNNGNKQCSYFNREQCQQQLQFSPGSGCYPK